MELNHNFEVMRTDAADKDFRELVVLLDKELGENYSDAFDFYKQYNLIDNIKNVVVVYHFGKSVGCGAIKKYEEDTAMEIKRMFTRIECRGKGVANIVLNELEKWALALRHEKCILETGIKQHAAIALYRKKGYSVIPNYGQYAGVSNSICFLKTIS